MVISTPAVRTTPAPAVAAIVELDEQEQRGEVDDVMLAMDLATLVDGLVFHGIDAGEVAAVLAARAQVLALARHVLSAATNPPPAGPGASVPACIAALAHLLAIHPDIALPEPAPAPRTELSREWAALGRRAHSALHQRTRQPLTLDQAHRWAQIGHAARLARLLTVLDRRLLAAINTPTTDLGAARALRAAAHSPLPGALGPVEDLCQTHRR